MADGKRLSVYMLKRKLFFVLARSFLIRNLPDRIYLLLLYRIRMDRRLDLRHPRAFTEKIQWLKLNWRHDILTKCADKLEARKFVKERIGPELLKELYGVYEKPEDIDINKLPEAFVLKVNNSCKQNIFCNNKSHLDWNNTIVLLTKYLKNHHHCYYREWAYKNITPRIICEEHLTKNNETLYEYGFYCYDGVPCLVEINECEPGVERVNMFDIDLNLLENKYGNPPLPQPVTKSPQYEKMLEYAKVLSRGFPFVRVDLICVRNRIYFGEMTFYPLAGLCKLDPVSFDDYLGSFLRLPA